MGQRPQQTARPAQVSGEREPDSSRGKPQAEAQRCRSKGKIALFNSIFCFVCFWSKPIKSMFEYRVPAPVLGVLYLVTICS